MSVITTVGTTAKLSCLLPFLMHTYTHTHNFQISIFQNAGFSLSLQKATNISSSDQMKHCTHTFYSGVTENEGTNKQNGSRTDLSNRTASLKQDYLILYTQRCCVVQRSITLIPYRSLISIHAILTEVGCILRCKAECML